LPADIVISSELLYRSAGILALVDIVHFALLAWRITQMHFGKLKWLLATAAAVVWYGIWSWAVSNYWDAVYSSVFPPWARTWTPWIAFVIAGLVALSLWSLAMLTKRHTILTLACWAVRLEA
jgi:hypothetical protein